MTAVNDTPLALATAVAEAARARGGRALVVGGFVRDQLLGRAAKDLDLEVFGVPGGVLPHMLAAIGRVEPVGRAFPVSRQLRCRGETSASRARFF